MAQTASSKGTFGRSAFLVQQLCPNPEIDDHGFLPSSKPVEDFLDLRHITFPGNIAWPPTPTPSHTCSSSRPFCTAKERLV
nr:hypothetical protein CFP56_11926 [Quercus suber]